MKHIIILGDPERVDDRLMLSLHRLFPECEVRVVKAAAAQRCEPGRTIDDGQRDAG
jgi:hypothetical protein